MNSSFLNDYINSAIEANQNNFCDNHDVWRFGSDNLVEQNKFLWFENSYKFLLKKLNLIDKINAKTLINKAIVHIAPCLADFEWLYEHLGDDESRQWLVQIQLYRALGERYIKLPLNNKDYWLKLEAVEKLAQGAESIDLNFMGWKAHKMCLDSLGYPLQLFLRPPAVLHQLLLEQYRCQIEDLVIEVVEGDVVIDAGGCYGETALYFALKAGNSGRVFTFEFMPENLSIYHQNMELNSDVAQRVELIEKPLWEHSGEKLYIEGSGPGTRVQQETNDPNAKKIETISIDDLVYDKKLTKLDFIKMDIEGAELQALKGAEKSIQKFRPKMAISIYHKPQDFWTIPQYIASLDLGYRFALRHFTIHQEETVLFVF